MSEHLDTSTQDELLDLLSSVVIDDATSDQVRRLSEILTNSVAARRVACHFLSQDVVIRWHFELQQRFEELTCMGAASEVGATVLHRKTPTRSPSHCSTASLSTSPTSARGFCTDILAGWSTLAQPPRTMAVAALLLIGLSIFFIMLPGAAPRTSQTLETPDQVIGLIRFQASEKATTEREPQPIRVGDLVTSRNEFLSLRFDCGAEVLLKGPAELLVVSPMRALLRRGSLTARVEESAHGFRVDTPNSTLTDLGTEFGVSVDEQGATDMVVFSGQVALQYPEHSVHRASTRSPAIYQPVRNKHLAFKGAKLLSDGEAMRITPEGTALRLMSILNTDYPLPGGDYQSHFDRRPVIASVSDNLREGATQMGYQIVRQGFGEEKRVYVDRRYEWNGLNVEHGIPQFLMGADYIMPFCDDKLSGTLSVKVELSAPARLYVLIDDRLALPPWLTSRFQDTGCDIGIDENEFPAGWQSLGTGPGVSLDNLFSIWSLDVEQPGEVVLGSLESPGPRFLMYCIAATPLEIARTFPAEDLLAHRPKIGSGFTSRQLLPKPKAEVQTERVSSFEELTLCKPRSDDAAEQKHGPRFHVESLGGRYLPHVDCRVEEDGWLPTLNDGEVAQNNDDLERNVWYNGQGRFSVDLLRPTSITQINTFSWHRFERAPQRFTLWGSNAPEMPSTDFDRSEDVDGWEHLGFVNTLQLGDGGVHVSSFRPKGQSRVLGPYRYLLWVAEDTIRGTFFTEIDVLVPDE